MKTFFTGNTFFGRNPEFNNRPWKSSDEMDEALINIWNSEISQGDRVIHCGNISWDPISLDAIIGMLNGTITLLPGEYDSHVFSSTLFHQCGHTISSTFYSLFSHGKDVIMASHWPLRDWIKKEHGTIHIHGGMMRNQDLNLEKRICVGADFWDFKPVEVDTIIDICQSLKS